MRQNFPPSTLFDIPTQTWNFRTNTAQGEDRVRLKLTIIITVFVPMLIKPIRAINGHFRRLKERLQNLNFNAYTRD